MNDKENMNVFANRNFRLVFLGALISEMGSLLYNFAVSFYILQITGNNAFLQGLYLACCSVALLITTPVGGVLGDRFNKVRIMYVCDYLKGALIILGTVLMLLLPQPETHLTILFALGIVGNVVSGIFSPVAGSLLPYIVEEHQLQQANAYNTIRGSLESIFGAVLAAVLYGILPIHVLFLAVGICFVISGFTEMFIRHEHRPSEEKLTLKIAAADMAEGIRYLKGQKAMLALLVAILFINFFITPLTENFMPYFVMTDLSAAPSYLFKDLMTPELWSSAFGVCFGISSLLGAAIMSSQPQQEKCGHVTALRLCAFAAVMAIITGGYWLLVDRGKSINGFLVVFTLGCLAMGYLISCINIPVNTVIMRIVDLDKLSKVSSVMSVGSQGMIPLASVISGFILEKWGCTVLLVFAMLGFSATALLMLFNRQIKEL